MVSMDNAADCIHCGGTAVRGTDFPGGVVLELYRCLGCGKKMKPEEVTRVHPSPAIEEPAPVLKRGSAEWRENISKKMKENHALRKAGRKPGEKGAPLHLEHKAKLRKARLEHVGKLPEVEKAAKEILDEIPPSTTQGTRGSSTAGVLVHSDWKAPALAALDAERMATYKRLDKVIAAIDAIKAL